MVAGLPFHLMTQPGLSTRTPRYGKIASTGHSSADDDIEEKPIRGFTPNEKWAFKPDTGHGLIVAAVRLVDPPSVRERGAALSWILFIVACALHLLAMGAMIVLPVLLYAFPIEQAQDKFESGSWEMHTNVLRDHLATTPPTQLDATIPLQKDILTVCGQDHTVRFAQTAFIVMWFIRCTPIFMQAIWVTVISMRMPVAHKGEKLIQEVGDKITIIRLTTGLKFFFAFGVNGPRLIVLFVVAMVGAKFLLYASNMAVLMLKVPPLFFLAQVDNCVFDGLASAKFASTVAGATLHYHQEKVPLHWNLYGASCLKSVVIFSVALWYARVRHQTLQQWRDLCIQYENVFFPACSTCGLHIFGHVFYH